MFSVIYSNTVFKLGILFFVLMSLFSLSFAQKQTSEISFDDIKGLWLTQIDSRPAYLILKKNNHAQYFYKNEVDNTVYKGTWVLSESMPELIEFRWGSGKVHILDLSKQQMAEGTDTLESNISVAVQKLPDLLLGMWARPHDYKETVDATLPSSYFGLWQALNDPIYKLIKVQKNRIVYGLLAAKAAKTKKELQLTIGRWAKHGQQLHILWEDGNYSVIDNTESNLVKMHPYLEGQDIHKNRTGANYTILSSDISEEAQELWDQHSQDIDNSTSISLNSMNFKELNQFYRGAWVVSASGDLDLLKLSRFGSADYYSDQIHKGSWYLSGTGLLINLENGSRLRLESIGTGFVLGSYEARHTLDSFPNKVFRVAPLNVEKLNQLSTRPQSTLKFMSEHPQLEQLAKNQKTALKTLQKESQKQFKMNPWWWPIWNDTQEAEASIENNDNKDLTNNPASIASSKENIKKAQADVKAHRRLNPSWQRQWPY